MKKVYNSAVVIIPPEDIWEPIQKIRRIYDRHLERWMPHITMLYPFYPKNEFPSFIKNFSDNKINFSSFMMKLEKFNYFLHKRDKYTLWLNPEPTDKIVKLQKELLRQAPDCDDVNKFKTGFTPHLSLGQIKGKSNLISIMNNLRQKSKPLSFLVKKIAFIWRNKEEPRDPFKIIQEIYLK